MTIHELSKKIAKNEALKRQVDIAQIKEILKVLNNLLDGELYRIARGK